MDKDTRDFATGLGWILDERAADSPMVVERAYAVLAPRRAYAPRHPPRPPHPPALREVDDTWVDYAMELLEEDNVACVLLSYAFGVVTGLTLAVLCVAGAAL